jgi:Zn-dependent alcohol dehydrogenase
MVSSTCLSPTRRHICANSKVQAAKISGCKTIICIDRIDEKLELAKSLGATSVINTASADVDVVETIRSLTDGTGSTITIDTTGNMDLIRSGFEATALRGQMLIVGVPPPDAELRVDLTSLLQVCLWRFMYQVTLTNSM